MQVIETDIPDVRILVPKRFEDHRGFFSETWNRRTLAEAGIDLEFVQENHSLSIERGTLRGLHYQIHPQAQDKLVRVVRGSILDVAVDIRRESPTFGRHVKAVLSVENWRQFLVPVGFAHGYVTLEANTEVIYRVTSFYAPDHERGLLWNDPDLAIDWGVAKSETVMTDRDRAFPRFAESGDLF